MSVFSKQLVLNQWLLNQLGVDKLNKLSEWLHHKDYIGFNDEGHRGASGEDWLDKREQLCEHGFS